MKIQPIWLLLLFFGVSAVERYAEIADIQALYRLSKPLLMPTLAAWFYVYTRPFAARHTFLRRAVMAALLLSAVGDTLLMFPGPSYFIGGLAFFLLAHLAYIGGFQSVSSWKNGFLRRNPVWILLPLIPGVLLLLWLWAGIPADMRPPVAVYTGVICCMTLSVVNLRGAVPDHIYRTAVAGALLFMLSDSMIAVNKFGHAFEGAHMAIMLTYIIGQFFLVLSAGRFIAGKR